MSEGSIDAAAQERAPPRQRLVEHVAANPGPAWDTLVSQEQEIERLAAEVAALRNAAQEVRGSRHGIYVASRASVPERAAEWRRLRDHGWPIVASWIDEAGEGETGDFAELWARIQREVTGAAALIVYAEPGDFPLKGALVEVGMALAAGVPVYAVLPGVVLEPRSMRPAGSWLAHPGVAVVPNLAGALAAIIARKGGE